LLEESAQLIYKEQFGDFLLSDDSIKQSQKGFSVKLLGEIIAKLESGSRPKGGIDKKLHSGVPSIGAENVIGLGKYNYQAEKMIPEPFFAKMKNGVIEDRDILIYKDGAYIGKTSLFQDDFPYSKCCVNEHVFLVHCSNRLYQYFLFLTLNHSLYYKKMQNLNTNSAQPGINQAAAKSLSLIWPDEKTIISFNHKIESMISLIFNLAKQNRLLQQARDLLLPKLMTGEIEV
jgi:type I restriction enzyme S subunit